MEQIEENPELVDSITNRLDTILQIMDENSLSYDGVIVHDIIKHGMMGLLTHIDFEDDDTPEDLEYECDTISEEVWSLLEGDEKMIDKYIPILLATYL